MAMAMPEPNSGCLLWLRAVDGHGYGYVRAGGKPICAHRVAWTAVRGPIPDRMHVCHKCDVPSCINPSHLFLGRHADNMADRDQKGRGGALHGESNPLAVLTADAVRAIRGAAKTDTGSNVAKRFGVHHNTVYAILSGKTWRHVL